MKTSRRSSLIKMQGFGDVPIAGIRIAHFTSFTSRMRSLVASSARNSARSVDHASRTEKELAVTISSKLLSLSNMVKYACSRASAARFLDNSLCLEANGS